jgi:hypothetical protein
MPNKNFKLFVDFEAKSIREKEMFIVDPGLHMQSNPKNATKTNRTKER